MFPSMKCTQTFVNGPLMSVLSKDGGLTFVHVTQRTVIPISLHKRESERNKELFNAAFKVKKDCSYDFIWTSNGKIFLRDNKDSSAKLIRSEVDLSKLKQR